MIYKYNKDGALIGEFIENKSGHIPEFFTSIVPPATGSNQVAVFNNSTKEWTIEEDNRKTQYYKKSSGAPIKWWHYYTPSESFLESTTEFKPPFANSIWDDEVNDWREKTENETASETLLTDGVKTIEAEGYLWEYDIQAQWALQLGEHRRTSYGRKILVVDATGVLRKLTIYESNRIQKKMFAKYLEDMGYVK